MSDNGSMIGVANTIAALYTYECGKCKEMEVGPAHEKHAASRLAHARAWRLIMEAIAGGSFTHASTTPTHYRVEEEQQ